MDLGEVLALVLGGSTASSLITLWGTRYQAKKTAAAEHEQTTVDSRRVSLDEFETFKAAYEERMTRLENELTSQVNKTSAVTKLLRTALAHIKLLHIDIQNMNQAPRRLPSELEAMLWAIETELPPQ